MKQLLFYGTLRKNGDQQKTYNFNRFGGQTFVKEVRLPGWDMFNLGYYPCIVEGEGEVTFELHEVEDKSAEMIERMEQGAGYSFKEIEVEPGVIAKVYYWDRKHIGEAKQIKSGNWCQ